MFDKCPITSTYILWKRPKEFAIYMGSKYREKY